MDKAQFEQIKQHGAMLAIASHLYKRGLITDAEYHKLTAQLQKNTVRQPIPQRGLAQR